MLLRILHASPTPTSTRSRLENNALHWMALISFNLASGGATGASNSYRYPLRSACGYLFLFNSHYAHEALLLFACLYALPPAFFQKYKILLETKKEFKVCMYIWVYANVLTRFRDLCVRLESKTF